MNLSSRTETAGLSYFLLNDQGIEFGQKSYLTILDQTPKWSKEVLDKLCAMDPQKQKLLQKLKVKKARSCDFEDVHFSLLTCRDI